MKPNAKCNLTDSGIEWTTPYGACIKANWASAPDAVALDELRDTWARRLEVHGVYESAVASMRAGLAPADATGVEIAIAGIKSSESSLWSTAIAVLSTATTGATWPQVMTEPSDAMLNAVGFAFNRFGLTLEEREWIESVGCVAAGLPNPHAPPDDCSCAHLHPSSPCPLADAPTAPTERVESIWRAWKSRSEFGREPESWGLAEMDGFRIFDRIFAEAALMQTVRIVEDAEAKEHETAVKHG